MKKHMRSFLFLSMLVLLISACGPQKGLDGQAFTSERFGYGMMYPSGWIVKDNPGEWADYDPLDPNRTNGVDVFAGYVDGRNLTIGVGARELKMQTWPRGRRPPRN